MFSAKKLEKLVTAGIISPEQKSEILQFDDAASGGFAMKALMLLAIFTIGIGVISIVASNWFGIAREVKLFLMFFLLIMTSCLAVYWKQEEADEKAEKTLLALFFFCGAAIGLIIQVYQLSGGKMHTPLGVWCLITLPLLIIAKKKYVAYFWVPLFLVWCCCFVGDLPRSWQKWETLLGISSVLVMISTVILKYLPAFPAVSVLKKDAFFVFYLVLAGYIIFSGFSDGMELGIAGGILIATSAIYRYIKDYKKIRLNIKFMGLMVAVFYIRFGEEYGLFNTGVGLIISGLLLIALIKGVAVLSRKAIEGKKE